MPCHKSRINNKVILLKVWPFPVFSLAKLFRSFFKKKFETKLVSPFFGSKLSRLKMPASYFLLLVTTLLNPFSSSSVTISVKVGSTGIQPMFIERLISYSRCRSKVMSIRGKAIWPKMMAPWGKLTAQACHRTSKAE